MCLDRDEFAEAWAEGAGERLVDVFSTEGALLHICGRLGVEPDPERLRAAVEVRFEYVRGALSPRPGTVETLSTLRDMGYRVGLISNCSEEVSATWRLDAVRAVGGHGGPLVRRSHRQARPQDLSAMAVEGLGRYRGGVPVRR